MSGRPGCITTLFSPRPATNSPLHKFNRRRVLAEVGTTVAQLAHGIDDVHAAAGVQNADEIIKYAYINATLTLLLSNASATPRLRLRFTYTTLTLLLDYAYVTLQMRIFTF